MQGKEPERVFKFFEENVHLDSLTIEIFDFRDCERPDFGDMMYADADDKEPRFLVEIDDGHLRYWMSDFEFAVGHALERISEFRRGE